MVNLFFEIKRNIPIHHQTGMTISNPDIGSVMTSLYRETNDQNIKLLTRIFLERAGESWLKEADKNASPAAKVISKVTKQRLPKQSNSAPHKKTKPKRIYRGQVVDD